MQLSTEQESELIKENMPKIYRAVDNFMARCHNSYSTAQIQYEDYVQEVSIVFLKYIRRCETAEQLDVFPWYDAINAMSKLVLRFQQFKVPNETVRFTKTIRSLPATVSFDVIMSKGLEVDELSKHWVQDTDTKIDFDNFMSLQNESLQRIVAMKIYGLSNRKIAAQCGVSDQAIDKKIKKLRECYDEFDKGDEEDE